MGARGEHLVRADRGFATGAGLLGRLAAPAFRKLIDQLDRRLVAGGIHATLPDGSSREIGFRAPGPAAIVNLQSWMGLVRLGTSGSVGWYKAWSLGEWSSPDPVVLFELFTANAVALGSAARSKGPFRWLNALRHRLRDNAPAQARENIAAHYDLGNDFYAAWLDETMTYSSAWFERETQDLAAAQRHKVAQLLDRLELKPGDRLLEIGCGWGSLAIEAARRGANVIGLTLSTEQKAWSEREAAAAGLSDRITIRLQDYRDVREQFDAVASVEMVEAVGQRWWGAYLDCIAANLAPGGRAALQFISIRPELFDRYSTSADFIQTYIFPGGMLLNEPLFASLAEQRGLSWRDRSESLRLHYAETLKQWRHRYDAVVAAGDLPGFSGEFHQLWRYYLMYCEGGFRGGSIDVAQVTLQRR
ncbi:class I SAM-dependent methyltransferase [Sphingomonas piscis]|uniref:Class I SAM-dependent methyltransferase n=1 Tax=Sphingomonas piscis TaxID=2714943 RepID=A0A6G7YMI7_9SPHN|nr:cyclopropane-fatty-acyl-phospholipid synthase family protein [Sphingomonas piscis]QIK77959.1 class I SAM-dependent methyltransferase [Sphingomonas piscis]